MTDHWLYFKTSQTLINWIHFLGSLHTWLNSASHLHIPWIFAYLFSRSLSTWLSASKCKSRTQWLWELSLLKSWVGSLHPSEQASWCDQTRGTKICLGLLTSTAGWSRGLVRDCLYFPSLSWRAEWELLFLLITNKPKVSLNKYDTQLWCEPLVIASAQACTKTGSHICPKGLCLRIRTEVMHVSFGRINTFQSLQKCVLCQKLYSIRLNQKFLVAMVATCSKSFYCSLLKISKGE